MNTSKTARKIVTVMVWLYVMIMATRMEIKLKQMRKIRQKTMNEPTMSGVRMRANQE